MRVARTVRPKKVYSDQRRIFLRPKERMIRERLSRVVRTIKGESPQILIQSRSAIRLKTLSRRRIQAITMTRKGVRLDIG